MRRRAFLAVACGTAFMPLAARAQQTRRIGVLMGRTAGDPEGQKQIAALQRALEEFGWSARKLDVQIRWQGGDPAQTQALAQELADMRPDLLIANTTPPLAALRRATQSIPIVFIGVADPVAQGFVQSLSSPGGNVTGFGLEEPDMGAKWVELLREIAPGITAITAIYNPDTAPYAHMFEPSMGAVSASASIRLTVAPVRSDASLEQAIAAAGSEPTRGLIVLPDSYFFARRDQIIIAVARQRLPAIYPISAFTVNGGLLSYGIDRIALFRRAAAYVDRVLKGESPRDLPVQQPTNFELIVNLKTAKALGLTVPLSLQSRADEVIE